MSGQMVWVWLWLVVLDMMMSETRHVPSKVSGRLCVNLWLCGCVPTLDHMSPLMNSFWDGKLVYTHLVTRVLILKNLKCRLLST
jgi:hypothetical protein